MVIEMEKGVDMSIVKKAIRFFLDRYFDVHIKNGDGKIVLAVFGQDIGKITPPELEWLQGIATVKQSNDLFIKQHKEFLEAWEYLRLIDAYS